MKHIKTIITLLLISVYAHAQNYSIQSKSATDAVTTKVTFDSTSFSAVVEQPGKPIMTYALDTIMLGGNQHTVLRDADNKDKIISALNCSEAELNSTFKPIYSGVITMLDTLRNSSSNSIEINVAPAPAEGSSSSGLVKYLLGGLMGLLAGLLLLRVLGMTKKSKNSTLKIDDNVAQEKYAHIMDEISKGMGLTEADRKKAGSFSAAVVQKYKSGQERMIQLQNEYQDAEDEEARYFDNLEKIYGQKMKKELQEGQFADDRAPQKLLLQNLLPLALHYESYIKIRQKKAQEYDKLNFKNIYDGGGELEGLSKVKFESNYVDNDPFVASLIAIMQNYDIDKLAEVNIYNKRIEK